MKQLIITLAILGSALTAFAQQEKAAKPEAKIAATVNGEVITVDDVNRMYANLNPRMREGYEQNGGKEAFVEQYLRKRLVVQEAVKNNFDKNPEIAALLRDAREAALFDLYVRRVVAAEVISDAELRSYYDSHKETFRVPERVKVRHIVGTPMAETAVFNTSRDNAKSEEEARRKIENIMLTLTPSNFAEKAMRFSEDPSAPTGGDLGTFERGKMVKEFEDVAFSTPVGQISTMFKTQFGWHVLLVESHQEAGYKTFEEVKPEIRERLLSERADRVLSQVNVLTMELMNHGHTSMFRENLK
jgi:parvulin-like peptidyl-prolyl isomerase